MEFFTIKSEVFFLFFKKIVQVVEDNLITHRRHSLSPRKSK